MNFSEWPISSAFLSFAACFRWRFTAGSRPWSRVLRTFQREMLRAQERWAKEGLEDRQLLLEVLRKQTLRVTKRARLIRMALLFFLSAVLLLII